MKTVVVDLDGTLANINHRRYLVMCDKPDFDKFTSLCSLDAVNPWCVHLIESMQRNGFEVLIVTARPDTVKKKTVAWVRNCFQNPPEVIFVRSGKDSTPDQELKRRWALGYGKENILFVVDDRQKVVDMWREEGIVCLQCAKWEEYKK